MNARHTQRGRAETEEEGSKRVTIKLIDSSRAQIAAVDVVFLSAWLAYSIRLSIRRRFIFFPSIRRCNFLSFSFFPFNPFYTYLFLPPFDPSSIISMILKHETRCLGFNRIVCTGDEKKARISCFRRNTSCWPGRISISKLGGGRGDTEVVLLSSWQIWFRSKNNRWLVKPYFRRLEER